MNGISYKLVIDIDNRVILVATFVFLFAPKFWEMAGTYKGYFIIIWRQIEW